MSIQQSIATQNPELTGTCELTNSMQRLSRAQHLSSVLVMKLLGSVEQALIFASRTMEHRKPYVAALNAVGTVTDELEQVLREMEAAGDEFCPTLPENDAGVLVSHVDSADQTPAQRAGG